MSTITATVEEVEKSTSDLQQRVIQLWELDRDALQKSDSTARDLGAALIKVQNALPYGDYEPWLAQEGIKKNRASYCVRLVNGKDDAAKAKQKVKPKIVDIKEGVLIRIKDRVWSVVLAPHPSLSEDKPGLDRKYCGSHHLSLGLNRYEDSAEPDDKTEEVSCPELTAPGKSVTFKVADLKQCLARLSKIAAARAQTPIYTHLRVFTADNVVNLQAADSDCSLTMKTAARADGTLDFLLELSELQKIVGTLATVETTITLTSESEATISAKDFSGALKAKASAEFNKLPIAEAVRWDEDNAGALLDLQELKRQLSFIDFSIAKHNSKHISTHFLVQGKYGKVSVAATDSKMMAASSSAKYDEAVQFSVLVHLSTVALIKSMCGNLVRITDGDGVQFFETERELLAVGKTLAKFPAHESVYPKAGAHLSKVTFHDKDKLIGVLKRHRSLGNEAIAYVDMTGDAAAQQISMVTVNTEQAHSCKGVDYKEVTREVARDALKVEISDDFKACYDANRLVPFLERAAFPVTMYFYGLDMIADFHANGGTPDNPTDRFLLLPLRIDDPAPAPESMSVDDKIPAVIT